MSEGRFAGATRFSVGTAALPAADQCVRMRYDSLHQRVNVALHTTEHSGTHVVATENFVRVASIEVPGILR
jgi:hypothetical protein